VRYEIDIRRFTKIAHAGATLVIGDATLFVDDEPIYEIKRAKVGSFQGITYADYPKASEHSRGGKMVR
jgi:3-hydroxyacyl-[acyl-carrier protein] dehydratase/trans-2-decenoyl-[acyl-carrier protein] isomerase